LEGRPILRDDRQVEAIRAALSAPLLVVSGGPGTGKTSLLVNMLRALVRTGTEPSRILLAAPTGRAAMRMSEALTDSLRTVLAPDDGDRALGRLQGATLHKLLVYRGRTADFYHNRHRPFEADVIAVDEVSMVDVILMDRFFQAIDPKRTRVILIGDKDHHHYVARRGKHTESYVGQVRRFNRLEGDSLPGETQDSVRRMEALFAIAHRCRILSPLRRGQRGTQWLNRLIAAELRPLLDPGIDSESDVFNGALIMITRNDYQRELFNGDVGVVTLHPSGMYQATFRRHDRLVTFPISGLPDWDLAFAMTVHKSQGAEFEDIWLLFARRRSEPLAADPGDRLYGCHASLSKIDRIRR
jgi:ATP-dependent exoDNAse (exonuclease V) alpha subunit